MLFETTHYLLRNFNFLSSLNPALIQILTISWSYRVWTMILILLHTRRRVTNSSLHWKKRQKLVGLIWRRSKANITFWVEMHLQCSLHCRVGHMRLKPNILVLDTSWSLSLKRWSFFLWRPQLISHRSRSNFPCIKVKVMKDASTISDFQQVHMILEQ